MTNNSHHRVKRLDSDPVWEYSKNIAYVKSEHSNSIVILRLDGAQPKILADSAAIIWNLINGFNSEREIIDSLSNQFKAPSVDLELDVNTFLSQLANENYIQLINSK